jgi:hypothetical protein
MICSFLDESKTQTHNILTEEQLHDTGARVEASLKISLHLLTCRIGALSLSSSGNKTCRTAAMHG